jgi:hypothetical protein
MLALGFTSIALHDLCSRGESVKQPRTANRAVDASRFQLTLSYVVEEEAGAGFQDSWLFQFQGNRVA